MYSVNINYYWQAFNNSIIILRHCNVRIVQYISLQGLLSIVLGVHLDTRQAPY